MDRVAVFVDAGYLFAQGSALLYGAKKPRTDLLFDPRKAVDCLLRFTVEKAGCSLLRIYWYDGTVAGGQLTLEQAELAQLDHVKVRLGYINNFGQQKGVDSLIVTDLVELARQRAICEAILLSGDEDVRIGVQIAQNFGVRVHLLGIQPSRGSQSQQLLWEADTTSEWTREIISTFISLRPAISQRTLEAGAHEAESGLVEIARQLVENLQLIELEALPIGEGNWQLPGDQDAKLLVMAGQKLGRDLEANEKRLLRTAYRRYVRERMGG